MNEPLHTLLLAQAIGLYLLFIGIIMVARASYYQQVLTHLKAGSSSIVLAGSFGLILGIFLVLVHNIWIAESEVLITLIAWLVLIKSLLWLSFPEAMVVYSQRMYSGWRYYLLAFIAAAIGVTLMAHGFHPFRVL